MQPKVSRGNATLVWNDTDCCEVGGRGRFLTVYTREILVLKLRRGTSALPALHEFKARHLFSHPNRFRAVDVAVAPHAHLALSTIQTAAGAGGGLSPLVHCELDSAFEGPIEVALDRRLFAFVTQVCCTAAAPRCCASPAWLWGNLMKVDEKKGMGLGIRSLCELEGEQSVRDGQSAAVTRCSGLRQPEI
jgi:hypothetical protein